jgi:hypothetical protein
LRRAVETFNPHKHVGECGGESLDADSGTGQTSLTLDAPLFGVSIVGKKAVRLFEIGAGLGELDVEAQPHGIAHCRHFPEYVVAVWACLMELEVGGAYFVGRHGSWPHSYEDKKKQSEPVSHHRSCPNFFSSFFSSDGSILTLYRRKRAL